MMEHAGEIRFREVPRDEEEKKKLQSRLNRIIGQINAIKTMLDNDRYCEDVILQLCAAVNALRSFGYVIFEEHLGGCVSEQLKKGNEEIVSETIELLKRI